jgi:hypothetical protein
MVLNVQVGVSQSAKRLLKIIADKIEEGKYGEGVLNGSINLPRIL